MGVAQLHGGVAGHVAAQLFLIHGAVDVAGQGVVAQVALAHVQGDEGHVGVLLSHLGDGLTEGVAGHHDDVVALVGGGLYHGHTLGGGVTGGLVVVERYAVGVAVSLAGFVGGLVKGLVGDVAVVGDHRHAEIRGGGSGLGRGALRGSGLRGGRGGAGGASAATGRQGKHHGQREKQRDKFLGILQADLPSFQDNGLVRGTILTFRPLWLRSSRHGPIITQFLPKRNRYFIFITESLQECFQSVNLPM